MHHVVFQQSKRRCHNETFQSLHFTLLHYMYVIFTIQVTVNNQYLFILRLRFLAVMFAKKVHGKLALVRPALHPVPVKAHWHHLGIDFIGPISPMASSANCYILTISDYCTKWVEANKSPHICKANTRTGIFL